MSGFHHRQAQLKYLEALGMFDYQEMASPRSVVVIRVACVYQKQAQIKH
jgi:acyl-CoA thioesterase FadM